MNHQRQQEINIQITKAIFSFKNKIKEKKRGALKKRGRIGHLTPSCGWVNLEI